MARSRGCGTGGGSSWADREVEERGMRAVAAVAFAGGFESTAERFEATLATRLLASAEAAAGL